MKPCNIPDFEIAVERIAFTPNHKMRHGGSRILKGAVKLYHARPIMLVSRIRHKPIMLWKWQGY
jgi:hypothetical protein